MAISQTADAYSKFTNFDLFGPGRRRSGRGLIGATQDDQFEFDHDFFLPTQTQASQLEHHLHKSQTQSQPMVNGYDDKSAGGTQDISKTANNLHFLDDEEEDEEKVYTKELPQHACKILHMNGFDDLYKGHCIGLIHNNAVTALKQLVDACKDLHEPMTFDLMMAVNEFETFYSANKYGCHEVHTDMASTMFQIWSSESIQKCFKKRRNFDLLDCAQYFLDRLPIISAPNYRPSEKDILFSRISTTGAVQVEFPYKHVTLKIIDIGGHRSVMKKWIHFFDDVNAILFLAALSDYDQICTDHVNYFQTSVGFAKNRLTLSLAVFQSIAQNRCFSGTTFILFFNKVDILTQKLKTAPLAVCFPNYKGNTVTEAQLFIRDRFLEVVTDGEPPCYTHFTVATDTENIDRVFDSCMDVVIQSNLQTSCLA